MPANVVQMKESVRVDLLTRRRLRSQAEQAEAAQSIALHAASWAAVTSAKRVACHLSAPEEPGTAPLIDLLASRGLEVLLPISNTDRTLDWALHDGRTAPGHWGIDEPLGPRLGAGALHSCDLAFVPAVAVDHAGNRLGRGAGYYDRALADFTGVRCAIVFAEELVPEVPHEPHDQPLHAALTPGGVFRVL